MQYIHKYTSPIGSILIASDGNNIIGLWLEGQKYFAETLNEEYEEMKLPVFAETVRWLDSYFSGQCPDFTPPMLLQGSDFRMEVWNILMQIPYGSIITYGEIADIISQNRNGKKISAQAIGGAVSHNPISIIIPCHRVVGTGGKLIGYAGGIEKKEALLRLECSGVIL